MRLQRVGQDSEAALRGAVEVLITEVFGDTERNLAKVSSNDSLAGRTSIGRSAAATATAVRCAAYQVCCESVGHRYCSLELPF